MPQQLYFVYLDLGQGGGPHLPKGELKIHLELRYSLATLLAENSQPFSVLIYTDKPHLYADYPVTVVDVASITPAELRDWSYIYRAKPCILLHALRQNAGDFFFLDSDTVILPGFVQAMREAIDRGAVMHKLSLANSSASQQRMAGGIPFAGNSGVIGLRSEWGEAVLSDALAIIDAGLKKGGYRRTLEEEAVSEALWRRNIPVEAAEPWVAHYYMGSRRRYMHSQIRRLLKQHRNRLPAMRPSIKSTPARVKAYQWYWDVKRTVLRRAAG